MVLEKTLASGVTDTAEMPGFIDSLPDHLMNFYGGNTTCATVTCEKGRPYIID